MYDLIVPVAKFTTRFHVTWVLTSLLLVLAILTFAWWAKEREANERRSSYSQAGPPLFVPLLSGIAAAAILGKDKTIAEMATEMHEIVGKREKRLAKWARRND